MSKDTSIMASFGGQYPVRVCELTLTVATAATTATATSTSKFRGTIEKIEIDPGTLTASATLKGYETNTPLATGTRDHFLDYTVPNPAVERVMYPHIAGTLNTGAAANPTVSRQYVVQDSLTVDLASATAADSVVVRIYARG